MMCIVPIDTNGSTLPATGSSVTCIRAPVAEAIEHPAITQVAVL